MRHCAIADFGTALDCVAEDLEGFQLPYRVRGVPLGGAPAFLAPAALDGEVITCPPPLNVCKDTCDRSCQ